MYYKFDLKYTVHGGNSRIIRCYYVEILNTTATLLRYLFEYLIKTVRKNTSYQNNIVLQKRGFPIYFAL